MGLLIELFAAGAVPVGDLGLLTASGLVGASLLDRFRGDDAAGEDDGGGGDPLLDDDGGFGGEEGDDDLDGFGGMDDWEGDDPFGGDEEDDTAELENRVDDLENEVAGLSSSVSTVRSENEEIAETVDDMGEDVRSLLDIYEMVTRGINPFVDDAQAGGMGDEFGGGGSFGLFDDDGDDDEAEEDLDDDLAAADADSFFDEDLLDEDDGFDDLDGDLGDGHDEEDEEFDDLDGDFEDDLGGEGGDEEEFDDFDADDTTDTETMATENGGGKSFSELKDEYESGDADWADGDEEGADPSDDPDPRADPDEGFDDAPDAFGAEVEPEPDPGPAESESTAGGDGGFEFVGSDDLSAQPQKPYLTALPGDYVGDLMVMEWLEYLVEESDATDAVRAINYYRRVEWVDDDVADRLKAFLSGFGDIDRNRVDDPGTAQLTLDHHTRSLKYIMQLTNATAESVVIDRWPQLSGGRRGSQR